ncbi:unnamed protein product [Didymodactylos carnosus]|uniref:Relish n=1 Tax=Didymodactylos carnosus TaxID=1234261 RepID=A0A8S2CY21_9BILA|nr:unnamed protein product [Didymodactylos carnosus]CAF3573609.1 unnamed protein product [Didymodactylos carnosus]
MSLKSTVIPEEEVILSVYWNKLSTDYYSLDNVLSGFGGNIEDFISSCDLNDDTSTFDIPLPSPISESSRIFIVADNERQLDFQNNPSATNSPVYGLQQSSYVDDFLILFNNIPSLSTTSESSRIFIVTDNEIPLGLQNNPSAANSPAYSLQQVSFPISVQEDLRAAEQIQIIAQPEKFYHPRYRTDFDKEKKRAPRYMHSEGGNISHPTIKIPSAHFDANNNLYIRVCLVTVQTNNLPRYIHPYSLEVPDSSDNKIIQISEDSAIYFPISQADLNSGGIKSFTRLMLIKAKQDDLRKLKYPLRPFDNLNKNGTTTIDNNQNYISNPKLMIKEYELFKSQLVFTVVQLRSSNPPFIFYPFLNTSVYSQIMTEGNDQQEEQGAPCRVYKYAPKMGGYNGGDDILIFLTTKIDKKNLRIQFESRDGRVEVKEIDVKDRMIAFKSPAYSAKNLSVHTDVEIVLIQDQTEIQRLQYWYMPENIFYANTYCQNCQQIYANDDSVPMNSLSKRRACAMDEYVMGSTTDQVTPNLEHSVSAPATIKHEVKEEPISQSRDTQQNARMSDKFLDNLTSSFRNLLVENDATPLFKCARVLIFKREENLLEKAILNGHIMLAKQLIKVTPVDILKRKNECGETVLLVAGKLNNKDLIASLLEKHLDLVNDIDNKNNNLFHILAAVDDDKAYNTIEFVFNSLKQQESINVTSFDKENSEHLTPLQLAILHHNLNCVKLFVSNGNFNADVRDQSTGDNLIHMVVRNSDDLSTLTYLVNDLHLNGENINFKMTPYELAKSLNRTNICNFLSKKYPTYEPKSDDSGDEEETN